MRKGFTMIELIFVIVIIGILAAVAIPKLAGVSTQAKSAKIVAYAGTLQRTTIPPYWSKSILEGNGGSVVSYTTNIVNDLDAPSDLGTPSFATGNLEAVGYTFADGTAPTATVATATLDGVTYSLACSDGGANTSPTCDVYNSNTSKWMLKANY